MLGKTTVMIRLPSRAETEAPDVLAPEGFRSVYKCNHRILVMQYFKYNSQVSSRGICNFRRTRLAQKQTDQLAWNLLFLVEAKMEPFDKEC